MSTRKLPINPQVHAEMFRKLQALDKENEHLRRMLANAHAAIESRNKLIEQLQAGRRFDKDREQAEAKRKQRDAVILWGCGND